MQNYDFELNELIVDSQDLVLDPHNPRIQNGNLTRKTYTDSEIISDSVQNYLLKKLQENEHGVQRLIESMRSNGFVNIDSIFVKRLEGTNKFLVLEGNRRTTAIKHLLRNSRELEDKIAQTLKKIPVKELICDDFDVRQDMTAFILSIRHLGGVKNWAPMQQAYSIYLLYMRELRKDNARASFRADARLIDRVSSILNQEKKDVLKALRIYVAFDQLKENDYSVKSDHYTLLEMAVNQYPSLRNDFFEIQESNFQMSSRGLERFNSLCIDEDCKIKNPGDFREFFYVFKYGTDQDLILAVESDEKFSDLTKSIVNRDISFYNKLQEIKDKLSALTITNYGETPEEKHLIEEIKKTVDRKLYSLI